MRRFIMLLFMLLIALPAAAQNTPLPPPTNTPPAPNAQSALLAENGVDFWRVLDAAERAERAAEQANSFLQIFEGMGVIITGIGALIATVIGVGGVLGLTSFREAMNRVRQAEDDLKAARDQFEKEVSKKQVELDTLRDQLNQAREAFMSELRAKQQELDVFVDQQLENTTRQLRLEADDSIMALSLLPLAEREYRSRNLGRARDTYKRALAKNERNAVIHYRLGYVCTQLGDLETAETHLNRALELDDKLSQATAALGYVYRRMAERETGADRSELFAKAEQTLLQALKHSFRLIDDDGESWWGSLGSLYRRRDQISHAIEAYHNAAQVTQHSSYPLGQLALLYLLRGDDEKIILQTYQRVERLAYREVLADTGNYWAYSDLVSARLALSAEPERVDEALTSVLETVPPDAHYALASLVETLQRMRSVFQDQRRDEIDRALALLDTHLTLNP